MPSAAKERVVLSERYHMEDCPETERNGRTETWVDYEPPSRERPAGRLCRVIRCIECGGQSIQKGV